VPAHFIGFKLCLSSSFAKFRNVNSVGIILSLRTQRTHIIFEQYILKWHYNKNYAL
jgi:hypothetical protein